MKVQLYTGYQQDCPYLAEKKWETYFFQEEKVACELYEHLVNRGWRRSGNVFYMNRCNGCNECVSLKIDVNEFSPSKSQRRCFKKNHDIIIKRHHSEFHDDEFKLYKKYSQIWHKTESVVDENEYIQLYVDSPVVSEILRFELDGKLIGCGYIDVLPDSISSVYFTFEPSEYKRALGKLSVMKEIELCRKLNKKWYHIGYYVKNCKKMSYKAEYRPHKFLVDGKWEQAL